MNKLNQLDLSHNNIKEIPEGAFNHFKNLAILDLNNNELEIISNQITSKIKLRILELNFNKIKEIPEDIKNLNDLGIFKINNNEINVLPETIPFNQLNYLGLINTNIKNLDLNKYDLARLQMLCISKEQIANISEDLKNKIKCFDPAL